MKKGLLVMMALTLFLSFGFAQVADAKRGGFKSPKQSFTQPKKNDNVSQSSSTTSGSTGSAATTRGGAAGAGAGGGLFGGSGLMKGLMIGGLAGMLFGGMFGGMGAFGEIMGLMVNLLAIFAIIMLIRVAFVYLRSKKNNTPDQRGPY